MRQNRLEVRGGSLSWKTNASQDARFPPHNASDSPFSLRKTNQASLLRKDENQCLRCSRKGLAGVSKRISEGLASNAGWRNKRLDPPSACEDSHKEAWRQN
jgi:hypothetical protein